MLQWIIKRRADKQRLKLLRKAWHLIGLIFPISYFWLTKFQISIFIGICLFVFLSLDYLRLNKPSLNKWVFAKFNKLLKDKEKTELIGNTALLTSTLLVVLFFSKPIAISALVFLSVGDVAASVFGSLYGRNRILRQKTLEGSLAFLTASLIGAAILVVCGLPISTHILIAGALAATIIEAIPLFLDDNFTIGLAAGLVMHLVSKI